MPSFPIYSNCKQQNSSYPLYQRLAPEKAAEHRQRHSGEGALLRLEQGRQWWCSSPLPAE